MLNKLKIIPLLKPWLVVGLTLPLLSSCSTFQSIYSYFKPGTSAPATVVAVQPNQPIFVPLEENQRIWRESIAKAAAPVVKDMTPAQELEQSTAAVIAAQGGIALKLDTTFASAKRVIPFSYAKNGLGPVGTRAIREMAVVAKTAERVYVRGRADSTGDPVKNAALAQTRATTVQKTFVANGVPNDKVQTTYCTTCYVASNDTEEGRRRNRRVDIELIMPAAKVAALPKGQYETVQLAAIPVNKLRMTERLAATPQQPNRVVLASGSVAQAF
jgi:outer membrane protein OmpA-like peptidoglycan-associated protein